MLVGPASRHMMPRLPGGADGTKPVEENTCTNVASGLTSFVGREGELDRLRTLLDRSALVTIVGPAGAGKTRLALELVRAALPDLSRRFPGGIWLCDLSAARSLDGIAHVVAGALGMPLTKTETAARNMQQIGHALAARGPTLLVLDNFEQVASLAAETIEPWRALAPDCRFLVASRTALHLAEERLLPLGPLGGGESTGAAVRLFVERARAVRHGYEPSPEERVIITEVVRALDLLPLAIELAASRMRVLGVRQIQSQLERRFSLLRREGGRGHDTSLREAIAWSWALLSEHEREALSQCSVLRGSFDLEAAEDVIELGAEGPWALDAMQRLVEQSLVQTREHRAGELRFRLYESVRAFAAEQLSDEARDLAEQRRDASYAHRAARLRRKSDGPEAAEALEQLALDTENLFAVHRSAVQRGRGDRALEVALGLNALFSLRGPLTPLLELLDTGLAVPCDDPGLHTEAMLLRGYVLGELGRRDEGARQLHQALFNANEANAGELLGLAQLALARHAWHTGALDEAVVRYTEAERRLDRAGAYGPRGRAISYRANIRFLQGDINGARNDFEAALTLLRRHGDPASEAVTLGNLGRLEHDTGRPSRARRLYQEALGRCRVIGDRYNEGNFVTQLGLVMLEDGDIPGAAQQFERALEVHRRVGNRRGAGVCLAYLGQCGEIEGDRDGSRRHYHEAVGLLHDFGEPVLEAMVYCWRGRLEADCDEVDHAQRFLDYGKAMLDGMGATVVAPVAQVCAAHLDLALSRQAEAGGDWTAAVRGRDVARAVSRSVAAEANAGGAHSGDVRAAMSRLRDALREADTRPSSSPPSARMSQPIVVTPEALVVSGSGRAFSAPGEEAVDLSTRAAPRRILKALADHRELQPGVALSTEVLQSAGWPGERLLPEAGKSRVYTAVATLRRMGLKRFLIRRDDGYLLDPEVPLHRG
ncbi:MAG: tetratricopeptide repeat protein [Myxococcota bacterium]